MSQVELVCPHCGAIAPGWGWSEHLKCEKCRKTFQIKHHVGSEEEGTVHKLIEEIDEFWNEENKEAKEKEVESAQPPKG
jgi:tRNA(Ile2) C34 agmatinyltransferase TiaS